MTADGTPAPQVGDTITTAEALDALPVGSGFVDKFGDLGLVDEPRRVQYAQTAHLSTAYVAGHYLPATVLFRPDALGEHSSGNDPWSNALALTPARAAGAGAEVDREALREAMLQHWWSTQTGPDADHWETLDADERENVAENSYADVFLDAVTRFLAARGAAAPTVTAEQVREVVDRYAQDGDDPPGIEAEDGWRLVRDLRALPGVTP